MAQRVRHVDQRPGVRRAQDQTVQRREVARDWHRAADRHARRNRRTDERGTFRRRRNDARRVRWRAVRIDEQRAGYPVRDGIPVLIRDQPIANDSDSQQLIGHAHWAPPFSSSVK